MPDAPPPKPAGSLEYDRGFGASGGTRRFRLLLGLTLFNTLMLAGLIVGPHLAPYLREKYQQWQVQRAQERERLQMVALEQKCLTHARPPNHVAYEEDPVAAAALLAGPNPAYGTVLPGVDAPIPNLSRGRRSDPDADAAPYAPPGYQPPVRASHPDYVDGFLALAHGMGGGGGGLFGRPNDPAEPALLFLHERATPGGQRLLVEVWLQPGYEFGHHTTTTDAGTYRAYIVRKHRRLTVRTWTLPPPPAAPQQAGERTVLLALPDLEQAGLAQVKVDDPDAVAAAGDTAADDGNAGASHDGAETAGAETAGAAPPVTIDYGHKLRVFTGQPDPADLSHFTIAYQLDGKPGTIDGRVRDDELVLRPSTGAPAPRDVVRNLRTAGSATDQVWDLTAAPPASRPARGVPGH